MKKIFLICLPLSILTGCMVGDTDFGSFFEGSIEPSQEEMSDPCHALPPWKIQAMPECKEVWEKEHSHKLYNP